jgi:hypothetical protein
VIRPQVRHRAVAADAFDDTGESMSRFDPDHNDRQNNAVAAKKALLEKFRSAVSDPALEQRRAAYEAESLARKAVREEARKKREAEERVAAALAAQRSEQARREAAEAAALAAAEAEEREQMLRAEQKAARDARYAARKAAQKRRRHA